MAYVTLLLTSSGLTMAILHLYSHLVLKNENFTFVLTSSGQEWQFHIATDHLVVNNSNYHIATDI